MRKRVAICLTICWAGTWPGSSAFGASGCDLSAAPVVPVIKGLSYDEARTALLTAGWQPGHVSKFAGVAGNESVFHERGYTELVSCTVASGAPCRFQFSGKGNTLLTVTTSGEENSLLDSRAVVSGADLGCRN